MPEKPKFKLSGDTKIRIWTAIVLAVLYGLFFLAGRLDVETRTSLFDTLGIVGRIAVIALPWALLLFFVFAGRRLGPTPTTVAPFNRALVLLSSGKFDEAENLFKEIQPNAKDNQMPGLIAWNLAVIDLRRGHYLDASVVMRREIEKAWFRERTADTTQLEYKLELARALVFNGDLSDAESVLPKPGTPEFGLLTNPGTALQLEFLLHVRKAEYTSATNLAESRWREIESMDSNFNINFFRMLWAFSLSQSNNTAQISIARPFVKGQYQSQAAKWPELQKFLAEQKLTDSHAAS